MATDAPPKELDSPSMAVAYQFWEEAKKEFESNDMIRQKDGCEKAYRAATEAIDRLLASRGYLIDTGTGETHLDRAKKLKLLSNLDPVIKPINKDYSYFKDQLHGLGFYNGLNPILFKEDFFSVESFLIEVQKLIEE